MNNKKNPFTFHLCYTKKNYSLISKKNPNCFIFFSRNSVLHWGKSELPATISKKQKKNSNKKQKNTSITINNWIFQWWYSKNNNPNNAHSHDTISIRMVKICDFICKPLKLIFKYCLESGKFLSEWKKANAFQFIKRVTNKY